jgi:hypothetical protein
VYGAQILKQYRHKLPEEECELQEAAAKSAPSLLLLGFLLLLLLLSTLLLLHYLRQMSRSVMAARSEGIDRVVGPAAAGQSITAQHSTAQHASPPLLACPRWHHVITSSRHSAAVEALVPTSCHPLQNCPALPCGGDAGAHHGGC